MEKKQIILPKLKYEGAPESDLNLHVGFKEEKSLLRTDDRDIVLDSHVKNIKFTERLK
jgi:hypothetical protein